MRLMVPRWRCRGPPVYNCSGVAPRSQALLGNARVRSSASRDSKGLTGSRASKTGVPKQSLGTRGREYCLSRGGLNMLDIPESNGPSVSEIQSRLHAVAGMLRDSRTIDPESRRVLAELVDELTAALQTASVPTAEV